jgi:hypothetical protein
MKIKLDLRFFSIGLAFAFVQTVVPASAQPAFFVKEFGDSTLNNHANSVVQINSGSIFLAGYASTGNGSLNRDFTLSKLDGYGNLLWTKNFGTSQDETSARMIYDGNKSLFICGQIYDTSLYTTSAMLMSVDTSGNQEWVQYYSVLNTSESFSGLCLANDGGIFVSGFQSDSLTSGNNFLLMKTNALGNVMWSETFGDPNNNEVSDAVLQLPNGDLLLSGDRQMNSSTYNAWLIKTDSAGSYLWDLVSTNIHNGGCKNILVDDNNNILVIGESATGSSNDFDIQLTKCDQYGNLIWIKYIPATDESDAGFSIQQSDAGHYLITGYYYDSLSSAKKIPLILIDTSGNEVAKKLYGEGMQNIGYDLQPCIYGGFLVAGTDFSNSRYVLIYDHVLPPDGVPEQTHMLSPGVFPNPFTDEIIVQRTSGIGTIFIYDINGKEVMCLKSEEIETTINTGNLVSGFYTLRYIEKNYSSNLKLLKF